ncbi:MAG: PorV/PorQ family protein [Elusimicrobia bacterium]|nr:PorV/PorQ family protein [Elusimicrobiota bacterium]
MKILLLCLILAPVKCFAGEGTNSAAFLGIDAGARSSAMASAYTAVGGINSFYHNPAGLSLLGRNELNLSYTFWLADMTSHGLAYGHVIDDKWTIAVGGQMFNSGAIKRLDDSGVLLGDYSYTGLSVGAAVSRAINENFSAGILAKFVREGMDGESASAQAVDAGLLYKGQYYNVGAAVRNFGTKSDMGEESFPLPTQIRAGLGIKPVKDFIFSADVVKENNADARLRLGAEYGLIGDNVCDFMAARVGYRLSPDENTGSGFSFGAGFRFLGRYIAEYSFIPFGDIGNTHMISLGVMFGKERNVPHTALPVYKEKPRETLITAFPQAVKVKSVATTPPAQPGQKPSSAAKATFNPAGLTIDEAIRKYQNGEISWEQAMEVIRANSAK